MAEVDALAGYVFIQAAMARGYMLETEAKELFGGIAGSTGENFDDFIGALTISLEFLQLQFRQITSPSDNQRYLGLVNKEADEPSKAGTRLSIAQNNYFRALLEEIARREPTYIDSISALNTHADQSNVPTQSKTLKLTLAEKQATLDTLVSQGWLAHAQQSSNGYTIGPRSFLELQEFLLSLDVPDETHRAWHEML